MNITTTLSLDSILALLIASSADDGKNTCLGRAHADLRKAITHLVTQAALAARIDDKAKQMELTDHEKSLCVSSLISAVKEHRNRTRVGLKESKDAVDAYFADAVASGKYRRVERPGAYTHLEEITTADAPRFTPAKDNVGTGDCPDGCDCT